jgi:predicted dehydrogenase
VRQLVREIEASDRFVAVNLFNRNAWYHKDIQRFIAEGQIGDLGVIRVCHMTPGHMPLEGHDREGPPIHDCGMHYVDVARWYANSEYKTWHAQGVRYVGLQGSLVGLGARHVCQRNRVRHHARLRLRTPREAAAAQLLCGRDRKIIYGSRTELGTPALRASSRRSSSFCLASSSAFCLSAICCLYWASCLSQSAELRSRLPTSPYIAAARI